MISAVRLTIPRANVSATTALEVLSPDARVEAMRCGSNVVMPVYTPLEQKQKYSLYKGKSEVQSNLEVLKRQITDAGRLCDMNMLGDPMTWSDKQK